MDSQDCKDILEQLRTVHLTLLAVCLAVFVIVSSPSPTRIAKASEQLSHIEAIKDQWKTQWLQDRAAELATQQPECNSGASREPLYLKWAGGYTYKATIKRKWDVEYDIPEVKHDGITPPFLSPPNTLHEFKAIWNSKGMLACPVGIPVKDGDRVVHWYPQYNKFGQPGGLPELHAEFFVPSESEKPKLASKDFVWVLAENLPRGSDDNSIGNRPRIVLVQINDNSPNKWTIFTTADEKEFDLEVRSQIIQGVKAVPGLQPDAFEIAFPELDQLTQQRQDLGFDQLKRSLDSQQGAAPESFEVFSIKFPIESTTRWAVLLILSIQGYFWLHLNEYCKRGPKKTDVAWIGIYTSGAARAVSRLTILIIPVAVILFLCLTQLIVPLRPITNKFFSALVFILSVSLAVLTAYTLRLVSKELEKPT